MIVQTREEQIKEIEYQSRMLQNLKKWMRNLIVFSSIGVVIAYWALALQNGMIFNVIGVISVIVTALCVIGCAVIGFAFKNGKANVEKIIRLVQE
jgi:hypothetical protein